MGQEDHRPLQTPLERDQLHEIRSPHRLPRTEQHPPLLQVDEHRRSLLHHTRELRGGSSPPLRQAQHPQERPQQEQEHGPEPIRRVPVRGFGQRESAHPQGEVEEETVELGPCLEDVDQVPRLGCRLHGLLPGFVHLYPPKKGQQHEAYPPREAAVHPPMGALDGASVGVGVGHGSGPRSITPADETSTVPTEPPGAVIGSRLEQDEMSAG